MKWMIASDIHGAFPAFAELQKFYIRSGARKLFLLGDLLYHGPRNDLPDGYAPKKVAAALNEMKADLLCVRGNCDCEVDQMVLDFPILSDTMLAFDREHVFHFAHGHHEKPLLRQGDIYIQGHTHFKYLDSEDGVIHINPGSVGIPKDGPTGSCIIYEDGVFLFYSIYGEYLCIQRDIN